MINSWAWPITAHALFFKKATAILIIKKQWLYYGYIKKAPYNAFSLGN